MADEVTEDKPRKRIRLDEPDGSTQSTENSAVTDLDREMRLGITSYVNRSICGFSGVLKQRYTDFIVNEILPSGKVLHLDNIEDSENLAAAKSVTPTSNPNAEFPAKPPSEEESLLVEASDMQNEVGTYSLTLKFSGN
jgi:tRNA pseudouridine13 synthase